MDEIIALEFLGIAHLAVECLGIGDRLFEESDLLLQSVRRPVGKLTVELMLALIDREIGIQREIAGKKLVAKFGPVGGRSGGLRRLFGAACGKHEQRAGHRRAAEAGKFTCHSMRLP